jgi:putative DNA primase/helicase
LYPGNGTPYGHKSFKKYGFDLRGVGGQAVAPGSIHPDTGKPYTVKVDRPVVTPPQWLLDLYIEPQRQGNPQPARGFWSGDIDRLPIKTETKNLIKSGVPVGQRSEAVMTVLNALIWSNLSDFDIFLIFDTYPIGEKYREKGQAKERWLQAQIDKARNFVTDTASEAVPKKKKSKTVHNLMSKFSPRPFTKEILQKDKLFFDNYKRLFIFDQQNGLWTENAEIILEAELRQGSLGDELLKKYYIQEILADVKALAYSQEEMKEPEPHLIPFNNIIYNLKTDERLDYSSDYFFTSKIATNFNPDATCPFIDGIFSQLVWNPVDLYELIGYCLYRGYAFAKWFFLYGSGGNGKTLFAMILEAVLGKHNIRSITTEQFIDNHFAVADLHGKFANLAGEMSYNTLEKTAILKQLVGGDLLRAERKYKEPFYFNNYAKLIFNTNSLPKTTDKTRAFYRRLYLIEFPNRFEGSDNEDKLLAQKITQGEIEGLALKSLGFLMNLYDRGFFFTNDRGVDELTREYERLTNPLITFLDETTLRNVGGVVPKWQLRDLFVQWLTDKQFRVWNDTQIGKEMKMLGYDDGRPTIEGRSVRVWFGIKWKE